MSMTCPHCNMRIKGNVRQCPTCNEWILGNANKCTKCGSEVDVISDANTQEQKSPIINSTSRPDTQKSRKGCWGFITAIIITILCIGMCIIGLHKYDENVREARKAAQEELNKRIAEDEKANAKHMLMMQKDSAHWKKAFDAKTIEATEEYIKIYPEGIFINEAYMLLEELNRRKVSDKDYIYIRNIVAKKLEDYKAHTFKKKAKDILDIKYEIIDSVIASKKYINRDSFHFVVHCNVLETTNKTSAKKDSTKIMKLEMTLDNKKRIIHCSI